MQYPLTPSLYSTSMFYSTQGELQEQIKPSTESHFGSFEKSFEKSKMLNPPPAPIPTFHNVTHPACQNYETCILGKRAHVFAMNNDTVTSSRDANYCSERCNEDSECKAFYFNAKKRFCDMFHTHHVVSHSSSGHPDDVIGIKQLNSTAQHF